LDIRFAPASGAAIDPTSFHVIYKYGFVHKDITDRIRPFVALTDSGVTGSSTSEIPAGEHTLIFRISDTSRHVGEQTVTFHVAT
jgi:hypothetical protein